MKSNDHHPHCNNYDHFSSSLKSQSIPKEPHPTAFAFTKALQNHLSCQSKSNSTFIPQLGKGENKHFFTNRPKKVIQQKALLLGWRNRHSLSTSYPVTIELFQSQSVQNSFSSSTFLFSFNIHQILETTSQLQNDHHETGACIWPASIVLLKYFERNPHLLHPTNTHSTNNSDHKSSLSSTNNMMTILDLGAGTGITSIATALLSDSLGLGETKVICTDGVSTVVELAKSNMNRIQQEYIEFQKQTNTLRNDGDTLHMHVCEYQWGNEVQTKSILQHCSTISPTSASTTSTNNQCFPNIILVSDCVLPKLFPIPPLIQTLVECMGPNTKAYLSYEDRYFELYNAKAYFWKLAQQAGLTVKEIPRKEHHDVYQAEDIEIWEVSKPSSP